VTRSRREAQPIPAEAAYAGPRRRAGGGAWLLLGGLLASGGLGLTVGGGRLLDALIPIRGVEVEVTGPGTIAPADVVAILGIQPATPRSRIDRQALRERLLAIPRIAAVAIEVTWAQRLRVTVSERQPVAMVVAADGTHWEVASDGVLLEPVGVGAPDLPLVTWEGVDPSPPLVPGGWLDLPGGPDLLALLLCLQEDYARLWRGVSEAHLLADGTYELFWSQGPTVVWGRGRLSATRLAAWATIMADLRERGEQDAVVDLRFREQVVVRLPSAGGGAAGLG